MAAEVFLELALVLASIEHQPVGARIADAVAENDIEPEPHLVDEIIHVAFEAAIVVAKKEDALVRVDPYPARELDRAHAGKASPRVEVPCGPIDDDENKCDGPQPDDTRLHRSQRAELIADVMIFERGERVRVRLIHAETHLRIGLFQSAKTNENDQPDDDEQRREQQ